MNPRCQLTDLLQADCYYCRGLDDLPPLNRNRQLGPAFTAKYGGVCADCGTRFHPGDTARSDLAGGYLGPCCQGDTR
jgi:hypothetical protein